MAQEWTQMGVPGFRWSPTELETEFTSARCFVGECEGELSGFAALRNLPEAWDLSCFMIANGCSGQGLGKSFLQKVIETLLNDAYSQKPFLWLEVHAQNGKAIALYTRCGFKLVGRRSNYYGQGQDALLMSLGR